ncbi:MAG: ABC transporter ATP-binding protein [Clostridiales bacterium]|nr:ABC transporter ATP-binding protein [Clostridiales bacterium]
MQDIVLEMKGVTKRFGSLVANDSVDFDLRKGEVHALLGENGAGKTTLMNCLYGIYRQEEGDIFYKGQKLELNNPKDAIKVGIGMVHQHFMLVPVMTVLENIILGQTDNLKKIDFKTPRKKVQELCDTYGFQLDLDAKIADLSVGAQQKVELVKALYRGADVLILDEPTAVLTPNEVNELFVILKQFIEQGKSIILISHKLWEVKRLSNRCTVLRSGKVVQTVNTDEVEETDMAAMMVGKKVTFSYEKTPVTNTDNILEVDSICAKGLNLASTLKKVSFSIKRGEILGVAGVDGNGQFELGESLMGLTPLTEGKISFDGKDISTMPTRERIENGFAYIPEDRMTQGLVMDFSLSENYVLNKYEHEPYTTHKVVFHSKAVESHGEVLTEEYDVRPRNPKAFAKSLSGGNQQKVILARELSSDPKIIIAMHPTRGLDIGASEFVHHKLLTAKENGSGVLVISADLDEILAIADRVIVINEGKIMGEFVPGEIDLSEIGLMMGGISRNGEEVQE